MLYVIVFLAWLSLRKINREHNKVYLKQIYRRIRGNIRSYYEAYESNYDIMGYRSFRNAYLSADLIPYNNFGKEPSGRFFLFYGNI